MQSLLTALIRGYRYLVSPLWGRSCRFHPSCSEYALLAIERFGVAHGLALSAWRVLRCHPWHPGGFDPVPQRPGATPRADG